MLLDLWDQLEKIKEAGSAPLDEAYEKLAAILTPAGERLFNKIVDMPRKEAEEYLWEKTVPMIVPDVRIPDHGTAV